MNESESLEQIGAEKIGPDVRSPVENIPGIFEIANIEGIEYDLERLERLIPIETLINLYGETRITWSESFQYEVMAGEKSFKNYLQEKIKVLLDRLRNIEIIHSSREVKKVVMGEIHCPKVQGCVAKFIHNTESTKDFFTELKIGGWGGGSGKSVKIGSGWKIPAKEVCRYIEVPVEFLIERCRYKTYGIEFDRASVLDIKDGYDTSLIPIGQDMCSTPLDLIKQNKWNIIPLDSPEVIPSIINCKVSIGDQWNHSLGINFLNFNLGIKVSIKALMTTIYEYELIGPRKYKAFQLPSTLGYYWCQNTNMGFIPI